MSRQRNIINKTDIPNEKLEMLARCFLPQIVNHYYKSDDNQPEFSETKKEPTED